jgi:Domain of unknown function (DUF4398)
MKANVARASVLRVMVPIVLTGLTGSCATVSVPATLTEARMSYIASTNGLAAALAPSYLDDATEMLGRANREYASHGNSAVCRDYSYIAENKFELADAVARAELFQQTLRGGGGPGGSLRSEDPRASTGAPPAPAH